MLPIFKLRRTELETNVTEPDVTYFDRTSIVTPYVAAVEATYGRWK